MGPTQTKTSCEVHGACHAATITSAKRILHKSEAGGGW